MAGWIQFPIIETARQKLLKILYLDSIDFRKNLLYWFLEGFFLSCFYNLYSFRTAKLFVNTSVSYYNNVHV